MSILYLIRHAQASFGGPDYDRLSELGGEQAQILAGHFNSMGIKFDAVYAGMQRRHEQTVDVYLQQCAKAGNPVLPVQRTDAFNEYDSEKILTTVIPVLIKENPALEAEVAGMIRDKRSFQKVFEKVMRRWISGKVEFEDLETWETYSKRVRDGISMIMRQEGAGKNIAVFTSGGPIAATVQQALNISNSEILNLLWQIVNTSVTRFKYSGNRLALFGFNEFSHLELKKESRLITYR